MWALLILNISWDTFGWNCIHIVLNSILVVPLIIKAWPAKLRGDHKVIYEKYFKNKLGKKQFLLLISKARRKEIDIVDTQLAQQGNMFDELLFMFKIPKSKSVKILYNNIPVHTSEEGDFIGMLETVFFLRKERLKKLANENKGKESDRVDLDKLKTYLEEKLRWDISVKIDSGIGDDNDNLVYYRWEREDLIQILYHKEFGRSILNALYSIWLERTIHVINTTQDKMQHEYHNKLTEKFDFRKRSIKTIPRTLSGLYHVEDSNEAAALPSMIPPVIRNKPY